MRRIFLIPIIIVSLFLLTGCCGQKEEKVTNVIYYIGDGMGIGSITALLDVTDTCGFELGNPVVGLSETYSYNNYSTDSAAGGTALATGTKTNNATLGMGPDGEDLETILELAESLGMKTGIVDNLNVIEATPAAFYACVEKRGEKYKIAEQMTVCGVDVVIAGGIKYFNERPDSVDLVAKLKDSGYDIYTDWESIARTESEKFIGFVPKELLHRRNTTGAEASGDERGAACEAALMAADDGLVDLTDATIRPEEYLEKAVSKALGTLSKSADKGYFLMIESGIIDGYNHNNDAPGLLAEMNEFDRTLTLLVKYVAAHPNTLLVVTADHDTGGTAITYGNRQTDEPQLIFATHSHTGNMVPVFAWGAGRENFTGIMNNSDIALKIKDLIRK